MRNQKAKDNIEVDKDGCFPLTKEQERFNNAVITIRSRVESPFSELKNRFIGLKLPFGEGEKQHQYLIQLATGIHNESLI